MIGRQRGVTFIEVLVVIGITVVLAALLVPLTPRFYATVAVEEQRAALVRTLRTARAWSIAQRDGAAYGVARIRDADGVDSYTRYRGDSYATRDPVFDHITVLPRSLTLDASGAFSGGDIPFARRTGEVYGDGMLTLIERGHGSRTVSVNRLGIVVE